MGPQLGTGISAEVHLLDQLRIRTQGTAGEQAAGVGLGVGIHPGAVGFRRQGHVAVGDHFGRFAHGNVHVLRHPVLCLLGIRRAQGADAVAADQGVCGGVVGSPDAHCLVSAFHMGIVSHVCFGLIVASGGHVVGTARNQGNLQALRHVGRNAACIAGQNVDYAVGNDLRVVTNVRLHGLGCADTNPGLNAAAAEGGERNAGAGGAFGIGFGAACRGDIHIACCFQREGIALAEAGGGIVAGVALGKDALGADRADGQRLQGHSPGFGGRIGIHGYVAGRNRSVAVACQISAVIAL